MSEHICSSCEKKYVTSVCDRVPYEGSGLDNVFLRNVTVEECGCSTNLVLAAPKALHRFIALALVTKPVLLTGKEIRFLRLTLQRKAKDFADELSVTPEQLSRVENAHEPFSEPIDKLIRHTVVSHLSREWKMESYIDRAAYDQVMMGRFDRTRGNAIIECEWTSRTGEHVGAVPCKLVFTDAV